MLREILLSQLPPPSFRDERVLPTPAKPFSVLKAPPRAGWGWGWGWGGRMVSSPLRPQRLETLHEITHNQGSTGRQPCPVQYGDVYLGLRDY